MNLRSYKMIHNVHTIIRKDFEKYRKWSREPLIKLFVCYLLSALAFAFLYWHIYRVDNFSFSFNQNIKSNTQWKLVSNSYALLGAIKLMDSHEPPFTLSELEKAYAIELEDRRIFDGDERTFYYPSLLRSYERSLEKSRQVYKKTKGPVPEKWVYCNWILKGYIDLCNSSGIDGPHDNHIWVSAKNDGSGVQIRGIDSLISWLNNLDQLIVQRQWGFLDFLYFSVVAMTTLGFGDIVPNSSLVRLCVVAQVLLGLFLLAIVVVLLSRRIKDYRTGLK